MPGKALSFMALSGRGPQPLPALPLHPRPLAFHLGTVPGHDPAEELLGPFRLPRAIPPVVQHAMYTGIPIRRVFSLDTSHAPNFTAPAELAAYLMELEGG
jgi:hypothetical protein